MLNQTLQRSSFHTGDEALAELTSLVFRFWEEDSTGEMILLRRSEINQGLDKIVLAGCAQEAIYSDILGKKTDSIEEVLIIDSGNSSGDSWKGIFHIQEKVLVFIYEA